MASGDNDLMQAVAKDYKTAPVSPSEKVMLYYAEKLTKEPTSVKERDIEALRKAGYSDRDIFDINQVVAYFNYVNRIADGLGVQLES
jgi:uncharacterized peroxidase-related enzyme